MARHAEESRDDLQAMKSLNVFYQVRPDFLYNKCFCDDMLTKFMETLYARCDFSFKLYYIMQKISTTEASRAKSFILLSNSFRGVF